MQPLGSSGNNTQLGKCTETSSKCVIWDGPDINCLGVQLCAGQSIEVVVYHTAKALCDLLDMLNINMIDLECLTPPAGGTAPQNIQELTQVIITKLCELNQEVIDLQNVGSVPTYVDLPNCSSIIADCPATDSSGNPVTLTYTDNNGNQVTKLLLISPDGQTSPAVQYFATLICELFCRMTIAESEIADLRADVDNLMNQAAGALPPVDIQCPSITTSTQIVDPNDSTSGVLPDMGGVLCDTITQLTGTNPVTTLNNYNLVDNCFSNLYNATPMGVYPLLSPPPLKLGDLGAINNPTNLQEIMTNVWVALCDLRNFATIVKSNCCPVYCASVTTQLAASPPSASVPGASTRDTIRIIMEGSFVNYYGATIQATSICPPPGFDPAGPPSFFSGNLPYTVTITDQTGNVATFTEPSLEYLFTSGNYFDAVGLSNPPFNLINTEDYTVTLTGSIVAPDYTVCNINLTQTIPAVCDNQPLFSVTPAYVGYDGVTVQYTLPTTPGWPSSGTTPEQFKIEVIDPGTGNVLDTGYVDYNMYASNYLYIYGDADHILPNPGACVSGCINYFQTASIHPNKPYQIKVSIVYNCGTSVGTVTSTFTTFVPIEITLDASPAEMCVLQGDFTLVPEAGVPTADLSSNFTFPISFTPNTPITTTVFAKAGTKFGFVLNTPYVVDTPYVPAAGSNPATGACGVNQGTRCWGPPSLYKYYPGNTARSVFRDAIYDYAFEGCYDYVDCILSVDGALGYGGPLSVQNIDNNGTVSNKPGNAVATLNNAPTAPGYNDLQIPALYSANQPIPIAITPALHLVNSGAKPNLKIVINDTSSSDLATQNLVYIQPSALAAKTISYNADTLGWFANVGYTAPANVYTTSAAGWTVNPEGVPAFMQIEVYKWIGNAWTVSPSSVYYVTSDWLNAGLAGISSTGFIMNTSNIGLRDKVKILWTTGCANQNTLPNPYVSSGSGSIGTGDLSYGKIEISQDPYPGIIGPFIACDHKQNYSYSSVSGGYNTYDPSVSCSVTVPYTGSILWGEIANLPQKQFNIVGGCPIPSAFAPNAEIEFIMSHDTTITWTISDTSLSC
jgi:hypothetical protein